MTQYSEHDVTANGIRTHYYRCTPPGGGAAPIVMLHGLTDNGICWVRVADALCGAYDIILPDTRGHGFSEKPAGGYSIEERAADVAGLIDALGLDRPVLFGHSLGGQAASAVAALYPERVRAVVLEDPAWLAFRTLEENEQSAAQWTTGLREDKRLGREGLIARARRENPAWHEDELGPWADSKEQMSEQALCEIMMAMRPGWQEFARKIQCPILLVTGDEARGIIINPALLREIVALNPRVREAHVAGAGHCIHRDRFEDYMEQVKAFLAQVV